MDETQQDTRQNHGCIRSLRLGCFTLVILAVALLFGRYAQNHIWGNSCRILLPDHSGSVVYMARTDRFMCGDWKRMVRLETDRYHGDVRFVPGDPSGADPVDVYWYPEENGSGPYLTFVDPFYEYFVDLKRAKTMLVIRCAGSLVFASELSSSWQKRVQTEEDPDSGKLIGVTVDGRKAHRLKGRLASTHGAYIGRIYYAFDRFVPANKVKDRKLMKQLIE